jgi:IclR helix-turn-helix domain
MCEHVRMSDEGRPSISITLSPAQVDEVVRAAGNSRVPGVSTLITGMVRSPQARGDEDRDGADPSRSDNGDAPPGAGYLPVDESDPRLSRSLLRGLSILTRFGSDGRPRGIVELAGELDMSASTAHRYASTLVELGLLERCPRTRKYRLPDTR